MRLLEVCISLLYLQNESGQAAYPRHLLLLNCPLTVLNGLLTYSLYRSFRNCWASWYLQFQTSSGNQHTVPDLFLVSPSLSCAQEKCRRNPCLCFSYSHSLLMKLISKIHRRPTALKECTVVELQHALKSLKDTAEKERIIILQPVYNNVFWKTTTKTHVDIS